MLLKLLADAVVPPGIIARAGTTATVDDELGYRLVRGGLALPHPRMRVAASTLIGDRNHEPGDLADVHMDRAGNAELYRLSPVVAADGRVMGVRPDMVAGAIIAGGRFATRDEAEKLDLIAPPSLKPRPLRASEAEPDGPCERLYFEGGLTLPDGRVVWNREVASVPVEDAEALLKRGLAQRVVKVRMKTAGLVFNHNHEAGEVVEVPESIADDADRFERTGLLGKAKEIAVDVLSAVGIKQAARRSTAKPATNEAR